MHWCCQEPFHGIFEAECSLMCLTEVFLGFGWDVSLRLTVCHSVLESCSATAATNKSIKFPFNLGGLPTSPIYVWPDKLEL